jgi:hypothetical protein
MSLAKPPRDTSFDDDEISKLIILKSQWPKERIKLEYTEKFIPDESFLKRLQFQKWLLQRKKKQENQ